MRRAVLMTILYFAVLTAGTGAAVAGKYFDEHGTNGMRAFPVEGSAVVYVFRPGSVAEGLRTWVFVDDDLLMVSKNRAYSMMVIPAGKHVFWSKAENTSALELDLEAGKTYYLKLSARTGFNMPRAKLTVINEAKANKYFKKCTYVRATEKGKTRAAEIVANRMDRAHKKAAKRKKRG